jgi:hypothetical protein
MKKKKVIPKKEVVPYEKVENKRIYIYIQKQKNKLFPYPYKHKLDYRELKELLKNS